MASEPAESVPAARARPGPRRSGAGSVTASSPRWATIHEMARVECERKALPGKRMVSLAPP